MLSVSTNGSGGIISMSGFGVNEYCILGGQFGSFCNDSWDAHTFEGTGLMLTIATVQNRVSVDKKGGVPIVIFGSEDMDVTDIDPNSLQLGAGEFYFLGGGIRGSIKHPGGHVADENDDGFDDLRAHFAAEDSDLACGTNDVRLSGEYSGVAFTTTVEITGFGKSCN